MIPGCGLGEPHVWQPGGTYGLCRVCGLEPDDAVHDHDPDDRWWLR